MATYSDIPKIKQSIFNPADYISTEYLTKSQGDALYINELPESIEKLIGSITVVGDETVTNQYVTGNAVISGNLTSGKEGDGLSASTASTTIIKGDITLGDQNNPHTVTRALGRVVLGWGQPVAIRGSTVNINTNTDNGTTATTIGNGTNEVNLNSTNVIVGNDNLSSVTQIKGKSIKIAETNSYGLVQIGKPGLETNLSGGQTNNLLGSQNRIFNPKLCDNVGNLLGQGFNLNNPSHFVFNQNLKLTGSTHTYCDTSTATNIVFFLNTPTLVPNQCYTMVFEFKNTVRGKLFLTNHVKSFEFVRFSLFKPFFLY